MRHSTVSLHRVSLLFLFSWFLRQFLTSRDPVMTSLRTVGRLFLSTNTMIKLRTMKMRRRSIEPKPDRPELPHVLLPVVLIPSVVGLLLHHLLRLLLLIFRKLLVDLTHSCRRLDLPVFAFPVGSQATGEPLAQICHF